MSYKNFFWDFDGTLYDTYQIMPLAYTKAWQAAGFEVNGKQAYEAMRLNSLGQAFKQQQEQFKLSSAQLKEVRQTYNEFEQKSLKQAQAFPGATTVLAAVAAGGGQNFLLTHRDQGAIDLLERDGLRQYFTGMITANDHFARKPAPDSLNYLLAQYQISPQTAIMVGDRSLDIEAAHRAGMAGALYDPDQLLVSQAIQAEISLNSSLELKKYVARA
ncbi:phosphoglycolate phosphatase haloacid dehalogenase hydrolase [Ligilactobacillus salitolerans]|uniref:Phosphoglycolate phosphatase haloacid dehalogenase hydrolase n=1 Tax=Ligilactobacillus salitolerans TaxID=1808352 RepID=A0A401IU14_9LACO|nr:HAD-IA family hydrolase [Ligilactobacillus salitolerans]GBG95006.1 phosphoglycolate phosphatase haloacid dehalogenase hydrolase [Ligilactobacillus salitolerans]